MCGGHNHGEGGHGKEMGLMVLVHLAPMLLLFAAPVLGISTKLALVLAVVSMVLVHLWMMKGYANKRSDTSCHEEKKAEK